ncbi:MAG TPA: hypothetical protein DCS66_07045 [Flavobacteriaceae bacterium]|nr:hypothetical protein [Flavobacteriaceae bacterium]HAT64344.1 hypothetical protein [Flavobacteriaceae bacterium]|tara:strand:+ start:26 stop:1984 length:1959 start_codon:yes stop_codon:yes gene_type:complete
MKYILCTVFLLLLTSSIAQTSSKEIDSLLHISKTANDSTRLRIYNKAAFFYIFNDSDKAKDYLKNAIKESIDKNYSFSQAELTNTYGIYFDVSGQQDSAKYYFENALKISKLHNFQGITAMITNNLGMFNWNKGDYQEALKYFFSAIELNDNAPEVNQNKGAVYLNNIGLIYQEMGQFDKALNYHRKSLEIREKEKMFNEIPASLNNIAINLKEKGDYLEAEKVAKEAIQKAKIANSMQYYFSSLNTLANIYIKQGKYHQAIPLQKQIIIGRDSLNVDRTASLAPIASILESYNYSNKPSEALPYIEKGKDLIKEFPDLRNDLVGFYASAAQVFYRLQNNKEGDNYLKLSLAIKDSIFSSENAKSLATLETKYNVAQQQRDLAETRANLAETELEVERKNKFIYGTLAFGLVLGLLGYLFYNQQKLKNNQLRREAELKEALAKIETQNKLQEQRLRISRDLHDNIGAQLTFVTSSVDNLKYGLTDKDDKVSDKLTSISAFTTQTIYELRDTIWAMNKEKISIEDLQARISNFIDKAGVADTKVKFIFQVADNISNEFMLPSIKGMNVYRIIQEGVNNALKYAEAQSIIVSLSEKDNQFELSILDDGKGFDLKNTEMGNGLNNIKKRSRDLGGTVYFNSNNKGTKITLTFPMD